MDPGENEWLRAVERESTVEEGGLHPNRGRLGERRTYKGCLHGGGAIWHLIGRDGTCCSGREGGQGRSLQFPRGEGGGYAAP